MKLEIGGVHREGWLSLNIDREWDANPDIIADAFKPLPFKDGSFEELRSSHVIEHAGWDEIPTILKDWGRVIKSQGYIHLMCPNFEYHVKRYMEDKEMLLAKNGLMYGLYGQQNPPSMRHRAALDILWLGRYLEAAGFENAVWDHLNPWQLNVRARKK